jgi:hypothetical protein
MEHDPAKNDPDGIAEIWQSAERRRVREVGEWLSHFFTRRRRLEVSESEVSRPQGTPVLR